MIIVNDNKMTDDDTGASVVLSRVTLCFLC